MLAVKVCYSARPCARAILVASVGSADANVRFSDYRGSVPDPKAPLAYFGSGHPPQALKNEKRTFET